jgi:hypothetical protein
MKKFCLNVSTFGAILERFMLDAPDAASEPPTSPASPPPYWHLLTEPDKVAYLKIRQALSSSACRHQRHHAKDINKEILTTLQNFIVRNDGEDWKRAIVCGICWTGGGIAINTRQLRLMIAKCKSSINAMLQSIGYATVPTARDYTDHLVAFFPILKDNFPELRKWTIRFAKDIIPLAQPPPPPQAVAQPAQDVPDVPTLP